MRLGVIPARGGSKRIPRKNIRPFCGRPMIAWTIQAAQESGCFDRLLVSTDDPEVADIARSHGADVPFVRPADLADDHTATIPVIAHAIRWQMNNQAMPKEVCCLYATAPFMQSADIRRALTLLTEGDSDYVFPVTAYSFPVQRAVRLIPGDRVQMAHPEHYQTRSQDLETQYHDVGQFYWGKAKAWLDLVPMFSTASRAIVLPAHRVQDIDTLDDWRRAEIIFRMLEAEPLSAG
jgi:pseudaminic acid cytidylyltransferase